MAESNSLDNRTLLRRTLKTMGIMVGACVLVVGSMTLVAASVVAKASPHAEAETAGGSGSSGVVPAANVHGGVMPNRVPAARAADK
jgi:hypothetical protein